MKPRLVPVKFFVFLLSVTSIALVSLSILSLPHHRSWEGSPTCKPPQNKENTVVNPTNAFYSSCVQLANDVKSTLMNNSILQHSRLSTLIDQVLVGKSEEKQQSLVVREDPNMNNNNEQIRIPESSDMMMNLQSELIEVQRALATAIRKSQSSKVNSLLKSAFSATNNALQLVNPKLRPAARAGAKKSRRRRTLMPPPAAISSTTKFVCPEKYTGSSIGYPFFYTGFDMTNCTHVPKFRKVLTMLMNIVDYPDDVVKSLKAQVFTNVAHLYPGLSIVVAATENQESIIRDFHGAVNVTPVVIPKDHGSKTGAIWNQLVGFVTTPFVLIARDVTRFTWDTRLERLVREIEYQNVAISAGSTRSPDGHWTLSCSQSVYRNFSLVYQDGYERSVHECVFCDYVPSPFVARTATLLFHRFDEELGRETVFDDFFLTLKRKSKVALHSIVCPDSMFHVHGIDYRSAAHKPSWVPFSKKWKLYQISFDNTRTLRFSCEESNTFCDMQSGFALSPCCLQELSDFIKFYMSECERADILCELQEGTLLGAVKFNKVLPWERDADLTFLSANYTAFQALDRRYTQKGYALSDLGAQWCCADNRTAGGKFAASSRSWHLEIYGQHLMDSEKLLVQGIQPTKIFFDGVWLNVPTNPALYVRNRYGAEMFRHAQHWMTMGLDTGWAAYDAGKFTRCAEPGNHACLDQYFGDGNLQFEQPVP